MTIKVLKLKGTDYSSFCRDCNFSECGNSRYIIEKAKEHCLETGHSVEYYIESGKVIKKVIN